MLSRLIASGLIAASIWSHSLHAAEPDDPVNATSLRSPSIAGSPAETKATAARLLIEKNSTDPSGYSALARALLQHARETSDPKYSHEAQDAVLLALRFAPNDFEAQRTEIAVFLGVQDYARADESARKLNQRVPDDVLTCGLLAEAEMALGKYDDAEKAVQLMLDLRPEEPDGLLRAAQLRETFGDTEGALQMYQAASKRTAASETERMASILVCIARMRLMLAQAGPAEATCAKALRLIPSYAPALVVLAEIRNAQRKDAESAELWRRLNEIAPSGVKWYELAQALRRAGRAGDADAAYQEFEHLARRQTQEPENANRELILYLAAHADKAPEALKLAKVEILRRCDVQTLDAYAVALEANGQHVQARQQIDKAMAVNANDPKLLYHAGWISAGSDDIKAANSFYSKAISCGETSEFYELSREALRKLADSASTRP